MKILLNECIIYPVFNNIKSLGHDVLHINELPIKGSPDKIIYNFAKGEGRILFSSDKHFKKSHRYPVSEHPGIVFFRMNNKFPDKIVRTVIKFLKAVTKYDIKNSLVILRYNNFEIRQAKVSQIVNL